MEEEITDDEDFLEVINILQGHRRPRMYRQRDNQFLKWDDNEFIERFRLSKQAVRFVLHEIEPQITPLTLQNHAVTCEEMLLVTLKLYACGSFLQCVGDFIGLEKSTVSRLIWKVTRALAGMYNQFIKMPSNNNEMSMVAQGFYEISRFPKCIGAVDCTHIKIISPGGNNAETYRNRKGFFSFNVQAVCDSECKFQDVVCRWPGSTHDAIIFANSYVRTQFERGTYQDYVLVGDSGYGVKRYLIPPLQNPVTPAENLFNESQIRTRNPIERSFGIWKRRFPILSFGIRLKKAKVEAVVIATAVLHNISIMFKDHEPPLNREEQIQIDFVNNVQVDEFRQIHNRANLNHIVRNQIINEYFAGLL